VLEVRESADLSPGPGQLRIDVHRAGLNFADLMARMGLYPDAPKTPFVAGYEVSGVVSALGEGAEGFSVGDRVVALTEFGGQASQVVVGVMQAMRLPDHVDFDAAAALPVAYLTAHHMLFHVGTLRPKERLLIHAAAGAVGLAAIQLARRVPEVELFGTASQPKHDFLRGEGLHHPIDYRSVDYAAEVRRLTGGEGVHCVLDSLGGRDWRKGYALLRPAGRLVCFGFSNLTGGERPNVFRALGQLLSVRRFNPIDMANTNRTVSGVHLGRLWSEAALMRGQLEKLVGWLGEGSVRPRVDRVFPLSAGADAHRYLHQRKNVGKVLFDCTG
jgi:NADPH:quinone reductase-like Zn-dependent oxidoreductase